MTPKIDRFQVGFYTRARAWTFCGGFTLEKGTPRYTMGAPYGRVTHVQVIKKVSPLFDQLLDQFWITFGVLNM